MLTWKDGGGLIGSRIGFTRKNNGFLYGPPSESKRREKSKVNYAEVGRHYASSSTSCPKLINQLANSGLDLVKIAQDFSDLKRPIVSPQNEGCTVPIIRLIHYEDNNSYALKWILFVNEELHVPYKIRDKDELCIIKVEEGYYDDDDEDECYGVVEDFVEDADEDNPEVLDEDEDNYIDVYPKYDDYADEYSPDKSDFQYLG
ncbi:hypothetical protein SO802_033588 [Lithocarpus litseifolius]|uniref:Uncharacterized protein n=1 Tax=Lithocarpus litseifolius TaxID=425828 RepID=A0AAW2BF50_9ROSI